jgi:hypothetical protein
MGRRMAEQGVEWTDEAREAEYSVTLHAWDFRPGGNFVVDMQKAVADKGYLGSE